MKNITEYEIIVHGQEHEQYFQGCGTAFTRFKDVVTGVGCSELEAYNDAVEQIACVGEYNVESLPDDPRAFRTARKIYPRIFGFTFLSDTSSVLTRFAFFGNIISRKGRTKCVNILNLLNLCLTFPSLEK